MRFHLRALAVPPLLFAAACSAGSPGSTDDPGDPGPKQVISVEQAATNLGVSIMASDEHGLPRLIRAIVPRPGLRGAASTAVARDHLAALAPLWVDTAAPMPLVEKGAQPLRNGAVVVALQQQVDG